MSDLNNTTTNFANATQCGIISDYILGILHSYYITLIIVVGIIGNALSCFVFLTTTLKTRSSSYYLAALAVADLAYLVILAILNFFMELFHMDGWCEFLLYISTVSSNLSTWLIVAFTVERFIAIQYPLKRPQVCTVSRAKSVIKYLTAFAVITHSYIFWTAGVLPREGHMECEIIPSYFQLMLYITMVDTVATLVLPCLLIVVMNVMIARNIFHFSRRIASGNFQEYSSDDRTGESISISNRSTSKSITFKYSNQTGKDPEHLSSIHLKSSNLMSSKIQHGISKMLLLVSTVFISLNLPSYVLRIYLFLMQSIFYKDITTHLWCVQQFAMVFFYTNFSINFTLYSMYGITFRRCLWQLIRSALKKIRITSSSLN